VGLLGGPARPDSGELTAAYRRAPTIPGMTAPGLYGGPVLVASVLSLKGGVGKTTVTLGLASAAVHGGVDTLLVDLDPQMNATTTVDPDGASNGNAGGRRWTVAEVLDDPSRKVIDKAVRASAWGDSLRLLPGSERTENHGAMAARARLYTATPITPCRRTIIGPNGSWRRSATISS